jgi:hypothetical protein
MDSTTVLNPLNTYHQLYKKRFSKSSKVSKSWTRHRSARIVKELCEINKIVKYSHSYKYSAPYNDHYEN